MTKHSQNISASIMKLAIEYINSNDSLKMSFGQYATNHSDYHYDSLQRRFKTDVGVSISVFIIAEKVKMAKKLIAEHENISLHDISVKCRYKHLSHMTNHFKKMEEITPMQYRTQLKKNKTNEKSYNEIMFTKNI